MHVIVCASECVYVTVCVSVKVCVSVCSLTWSYSLPILFWPSGTHPGIKIEINRDNRVEHTHSAPPHTHFKN